MYTHTTRLCVCALRSVWPKRPLTKSSVKCRHSHLFFNAYTKPIAPLPQTKCTVFHFRQALSEGTFDGSAQSTPKAKAAAKETTYNGSTGAGFMKRHKLLTSSNPITLTLLGATGKLAYRLSTPIHKTGSRSRFYESAQTMLTYRAATLSLRALAKFTRR